MSLWLRRNRLDLYPTLQAVSDDRELVAIRVCILYLIYSD